MRTKVIPKKSREISCQTNNGDEHIGLEEKLRMIDHAYSTPVGKGRVSVNFKKFQTTPILIEDSK